MKGQKLRFDPLWNRVYDEFHRLYGGFCAYTCFYQADRATVDHFQPKRRYPCLAYEWDNYRLASPRINQFKGIAKTYWTPLPLGKDGSFWTYRVVSFVCGTDWRVLWLMRPHARLMYLS